MSEEEKEAIESLKGKEISIEINWTPEQKATFEKALGIEELEGNCIKVDILIKLIDKLQKEVGISINLIKELRKENQELKRCIDAQKILRKDMPKDTKLILMYSEDYKRIFKEE